ncbi:MAG TPA: hypothetical protein VK694_07620 [Verrucomicrobiae bacterium]|nr:hypothetical protein [Verrucomicrobiae bacterium]
MEDHKKRPTQREEQTPDFERFMEYGQGRMKRDEYGEAASWFVWAYVEATKAPPDLQGAAAAAVGAAEAQSLTERTEDAERWQEIAAACLRQLE